MSELKILQLNEVEQNKQTNIFKKYISNDLKFKWHTVIYPVLFPHLHLSSKEYLRIERGIWLLYIPCAEISLGIMDT